MFMSQSDPKQLKKRQWLTEVQDKLTEQVVPEEETKQPPLPSDEAGRQALVENRIEQAMAEGKFDNLPGHGKPLKLNDNPYLETGKQLAFNLMQQNGLAPEWIERDKAIRQQLERARAHLRQAWQNRMEQPVAWDKAQQQFAQALDKINRQINDFNLIVPILSNHRARLTLADELKRLED
jgi:hypothetical protein